jgi:hypothetical protein
MALLAAQLSEVVDDRHRPENNRPEVVERIAILGALLLDLAASRVRSQEYTIINATLSPVANSSFLYGSAGQLTDPCNGLFTFRAITGTYEHDVFVTFVGNSVVFAKFSANLPWSQSSGYSYWYGVGLK